MIILPLILGKEGRSSQQARSSTCIGWS